MLLQFFKSLFQRKSATIAPQKKTGTIRYFNHRRGYGFIRSPQVIKDVFLHVKDLDEKVRVGNKVSFEVENEPKGLRAKNVELIES